MASKVTANFDNGRPDRIRLAVANGLDSVGIHLEGAAVELAPRDTGRLAGSVTWATTMNGSNTRAPATMGDGVDKPSRPNVVHIGTNVEYAAIQEYGGTISAKKAKYLRFKTKDGKWHSRKSVTIPEQSYLRKAFDSERDVAVQKFSDVIKGALHGEH